jgi:hypothetical protein
MLIIMLPAPYEVTMKRITSGVTERNILSSLREVKANTTLKTDEIIDLNDTFYTHFCHREQHHELHSFNAKSILSKIINLQK